MLTDIRHSLRLLRRSPALTLAAICTLAVAMGASTAVFSVIDKVLVRPLPIDSPERIAVIWSRERLTSGSIGEFAYATFRSWQRELRVFESLAAIGSTNWSLILREGEPVTIPVAAVSASFFPLMGTPAARGRTLLPTDDERGAERVAILSHASWVRRFGTDAGIIGRPLRFNDAVYTVVGVMPEDFDYPRGAELWVPVVPQLVDASAGDGYDLLTETGVGLLFLLGRLNPGVPIDAARDEVSGLLALGAGTTFRTGMEAVLTPLDEHIFGTTRSALILLAACVGLVLMIGCANVAVLLLARSATRAHETAVRLAIGATRWHIVRRSLADALLLAILGGAAGLGLAYWTVDLLVGLAPPDVPRLDAVRFDLRTFIFAWATCLVTTVLVGLGPGLHASRWTLTNALSHSSSRATRSQRVRRVFVVAQVGLALVLLVCAGLVGRSFVNLLRLDIGFNPVNVLTLDVTVPDVSGDRHNRFYTELLARIAAIPGVDTAGAIFLRPLEHTGIGSDVPLLIEGQSIDLALRHSERNPVANLESVTRDYFDAIGIRLLRGRTFVDTDTAGAPRVAIVSDDLAQRLWPGQDPIGRRIYAPGVVERADAPLQQRWPTVVGVVGDARYRGLSDPRVDLYVPYLQHPNLLVKHLMVRTDRDPLAFVDVIRREARQLEPTVIVENVATMEQIVGQAMAPWRFSALTLALLGVLALVLAASGVCAVVSQFVIERTREIGVRVAIGARPRHIAGLFLRDSLRLTAIGVAIGVIVAVGIAQVLTSLLYDVPPYDPLTLAAMAALFTVISTAGTLLPVWRAVRITPVEALRTS